MTPQEVLNKAADLLEQDGWVQGSFYKQGCGWCADGAIRRVGGSYPDDDYGPTLAPHTQVVLQARCELETHLGCGLWGWNDAPGRTKEEVTEALRAAARG